MFGVKNYSSSTHANFHVADEARSEKPFKTVIIGDNASGKTRYIISLIETFRLLHQEKNGGSTRKKSNQVRQLVSSQGDIRLCYGAEGNFVDVTINKQGIDAVQNGQSVPAIDVSLPSRIIAISTTYNDKFPFSTNDEVDDDFYKYCGIRETSNASWSATLARKTIENLLKLDTFSAAEPIDALFTQMRLRTKFRISFRAKNKRKFSEATRSPSALLEMIHGYAQYNKRMQVGMFAETTKLDVDAMFEGFKHMKGDNGVYFFEIDLKSDGEDHETIYNFLNTVRRVGLIRDSELELFRLAESAPYSFSSASSGETQLLYGFSNILRYARNESIILIDEPETSLHPAWQIRYVSLLKKSLASIKNCHLIIASHSHFILSDLDEDNSSLHIFTKNEDGKVSIENVKYSTYAWSPENILYSVFHVRTVGNLAFEHDLELALDLISKKDSNIESLERLADTFGHLVFDSSDPLAKVVSSIKDYLNDNKTVVS